MIGVALGSLAVIVAFGSRYRVVLPGARIDWVGVNTPLVYESMVVDNVFQAGETWEFIIQDYTNQLGGPPTPFDSVGIAGLSGGWPPSTGSIIGSPVPVPAAFWLLGSGIIGIAGIRRKGKQ